MIDVDAEHDGLAAWLGGIGNAAMMGVDRTITDDVARKLKARWNFKRSHFGGVIDLERVDHELLKYLTAG